MMVKTPRVRVRQFTCSSTAVAAQGERPRPPLTSLAQTQPQRSRAEPCSRLSAGGRRGDLAFHGRTPARAQPNPGSAAAEAEQLS